MEYDELRALCIRYWNFHPDVTGNIDELWAELNKHPGWSRHVAAPSAVMLLGELARFCDKHKPTAPQPTPAQS